MKLTLKGKRGTTEFPVGGTPRVNLLPQAVAAQRVQKALFLQWGVRVGAAVAVLVLASAGMFAWRGMVALQLGNERAEADRLIAQIAEKAEIQQLVDTESELQEFADSAMATDLEWTSNVAALLNHFPEGASLCGFTLTAGNLPSGAPTESVGLGGELTICGEFRSAVPFLDSMAAAQGVLGVNAVSGELDQDPPVYKHVLAVELDQTAYLSVQDSLKESVDEKNDATDEPTEGEDAS